jgi:hypothetical protein
MEKIVSRKSLESFRTRENPWKDRSPAERFIATAVISGTTQQDGQPEPRFPRIYRVFKRGEG